MTKADPNNQHLERSSKQNPVRVEQRESGSLQGRISQINMEQFQGPIPPPSLLRQYDEIVPGAADRIITIMEKQVNHRIFLEHTVIVGDNRRAYLGLAAGFIVAIVLFYFAYQLVLAGHSIEGTLLGTVDIVALVSAFIYGSRNRIAERADKRAERDQPEQSSRKQTPRGRNAKK